MTVKHSTLSGSDELHGGFRWTPADAAARLAIVVTATQAARKYQALQLDDFSVWTATTAGTGAGCWAPVSRAQVPFMLYPQASAVSDIPGDTAIAAMYKVAATAPSTAAESDITIVCPTQNVFVFGQSFATPAGVPGVLSLPSGTALRYLFAKISGGAGNIKTQLFRYKDSGNEATTGAVTTISFVNGSPATIHRSAGSFLADGFTDGALVAVAGASHAGNNKSFLVQTVTAADLTLVLNDTVTAEAAGSSITVTTKEKLLRSDTSDTFTNAAFPSTPMVASITDPLGYTFAAADRIVIKLWGSRTSPGASRTITIGTEGAVQSFIQTTILSGAAAVERGTIVWYPATAAARALITVNAGDVHLDALQGDDFSRWTAIAAGTGADKWAPSMGRGNRAAYFQTRAGLLEPSSIKKAQVGTFTYTPPANETHYVLSSYATSLSGSGRFEIRDPEIPLALRNASLIGGQSDSVGLVTYPRATLYDDPEGEFYRRLALLDTLDTKFLALPTAATEYPFIPGPYGSIITRCVEFGLSWVAGQSMVAGASVPFQNETGDDAATDYQRLDKALSLLATKGTIAGVKTGYSGGVGTSGGGVAYKILPAAWATVPTYSFQDDFMGAALNAGVWTKTESTASNVIIDTNFAALKIIGNNTFTGNNVVSVATYARASLAQVVCDIWQPDRLDSKFFGFVSGSTTDYSDFRHGVGVRSAAAGGPYSIVIYEDGALLANVTTGSPNCFYSIRITLGVTKGALYEIQGGVTWPLLGGAAWTTLLDTRGTSAVTASPLKIACCSYYGGPSYFSNVRVS